MATGERKQHPTQKRGCPPDDGRINKLRDDNSHTGPVRVLGAADHNVNLIAVAVVAVIISVVTATAVPVGRCLAAIKRRRRVRGWFGG